MQNKESIKIYTRCQVRFKCLSLTSWISLRSCHPPSIILFLLPVDSPADPQATPLHSLKMQTWLTVTLHHCSWGCQCLLGTPSSILAFQFHCLLSYNDLTFHPPQLPSLLYTMSLHTTVPLPVAQYQASHPLSSICYPGSFPLVPQLRQFIEPIHVFVVPPHPSLNPTTHHCYSLHCTCSNLPYTQPWLITNPTLHLHLSHRHPSHWWAHNYAD